MNKKLTIFIAIYFFVGAISAIYLSVNQTEYTKEVITIQGVLESIEYTPVSVEKGMEIIINGDLEFERQYGNVLVPEQYVVIISVDGENHTFEGLDYYNTYKDYDIGSEVPLTKTIKTPIG